PVVPAFAGGALQTFDVTNLQPSSIPGFDLADVVGIRWDSRCIPVAYSMNTTLDPIPNPLGAPVLTLAQAQAALQDSLDSWNEIRTSFIDMQIVSTTANPGTRAFDMVNELTFRTAAGFGAIASSPSVSLIADVTLADGTDVDGDGDSDVSSAITTCADVDSDGDVELPAGDYPAGTILDNDVQFNAAALRFTADPAAADNIGNSVDLVGVATHEFGHSHGLSHVLNNQKRDNDGRAATMYPFIDTGDPVAETSIRQLDSDDVAWSSFFYPEGSASSGPAKKQGNDRRFSSDYRVIRGSVTDGDTGEPIAGASVGAYTLLSDKLISTGFSGHVKLLRRQADGAFFFPIDTASGIVDGDFEIPVPRSIYRVGMEAVDGAPVAPGSINFTVQVGGNFGQLDFEEEFFNHPFEAALETYPNAASIVQAVGSNNSIPNVALVTNTNTRAEVHGSLDFIGFTLGPGGLWYAVQFPRDEIELAFDGGLDLLQAGLFRTAISDASVVPRFDEAALVTGVVQPDGSALIDLDHPLRRTRPFIGQDGDFAPYWFQLPQLLSLQIEWWLAHGPPEEDLFLVLQLPQDPWPGFNGLAPAIGLDGVPGGVNDVPIAGRSFVSTDDGATFQQETRFNYMFSMLWSAD
ncbi:MAG TPA: matrixin family metalloprotease, partial [Thermoanaerobaculia bacterium]|nr:matrixin family metalloprotease [Thermoanaerobaculia bacterium]